MTSQLHDDLVATRALIDTPEKWTKHNYHGLRNGKDCFCIAGAAYVATGGMIISHIWDPRGSDRRRRRDVFHALTGTVYETRVQNFNDADDTSHADVMALFDRAIKANP